MEQHGGGPSDWRGVYTRRGSSNVFDALYTRGSETRQLELTLDRVGSSSELRLKRNDYPLLSPTIVADGVAHGSYQGGTRFELRCGGR